MQQSALCLISLNVIEMIGGWGSEFAFRSDPLPDPRFHFRVYSAPDALPHRSCRQALREREVGECASIKQTVT